MSTLPDDSIGVAEIRADGADLFCELYDRFQATIVQDGLDVATIAAFRRRTQIGGDLTSIVQQVRQAVEGTGTCPVADYDEGTAFATLVGLHQALEGVGQLTRGRSGLSRIRRRLADTGRLNDRAEGALMPRHPRPSSPQARTDMVASLFPSLARVGRDDWSRLGLVLPTADYWSVSSTARNVKVASLPWFTEPADLTMDRVGTKPRMYSVWPAQGMDRADRVREGLSALDESGAVLGLLPEFTLDNETLREWKDQCLQTARGYSGPLRWIFVGTGPLDVQVEAATIEIGRSNHQSFTRRNGSRPTNKAVIIDRQTGEIIFTQDKNPGFNLTQENFRKYKQQDAFDREVYIEWLDSSSRIWCLELPIGRIVVLVCEALDQNDLQVLVERVSADIVLSPLLALNITENSFAYKAAIRLSKQAGTSVAVFNSKGFLRRDIKTVSTMLTVVPQSDADAYKEPECEWVPPAGLDEPFTTRQDAVAVRHGELCTWR